MFNVGGPEIMVVLLVALVVLGPEQLPKAMRTFGNVLAQVRKVSNGFQDEMRSAMQTLENPVTTPSTATSTSRSTAPSAETPTADPGATEAAGPHAPPAAEPAAPVVDPVSERPGVSSADRAAG